MSRAAADIVTVLGLDDVVSVSKVATVVWDQEGNVSDQELMTQTLATIRVLLDCGWAEFGDMVVDEWTAANQELALSDPDEAMRRLFARSKALAAQAGGSHRSPIRKWSLTTAETLARIEDQWIALGTRTPDPPDTGWLLATATGDERGRMILSLQDQLIDFLLKDGHGSVVRLGEATTHLKELASDLLEEELKEVIILALDSLLSEKLIDVGELPSVSRETDFARWSFDDVDEALDRVRRRCAWLPGKPPEGMCAVRVL